MNKDEKQELKKKIMSVEETLRILKHQETNLLQLVGGTPYNHDDPTMRSWIHEIFVICGYIVRLEGSLKLLKANLNPRRDNGGKEKD